MSAVTGIGIALLLLITVPKILSFYNVSLSAYGPYLTFVVFIIILSFILPHDFLVTVTNPTNVFSGTTQNSQVINNNNNNNSNNNI
jgi:hypothetical protein